MSRRAILRPGDLPLYLPGHGMPDLSTNNLNIKRPDWDDPADVERWIRDMNAVLDRCEAICDDVLAGRRSWRL
ncbi:hypothetical protein ACM64Y_03585 [Novispirillum sp. DQ9]|uniref:hypothetical protein n=1 Tax=Novispirillum sp. DQ9 TaxID=3398612 RepID=UPI003C7E6109